jgi:hypothetical protein
MRARVLFAGIVGALLLAVASPAAAKWTIAKAHISGPGLGRGDLRISGPAIEGMWESGIDATGGLDDTRADSAAELGLTAAELGPRYLVTYRIHGGGSTAVEIVRQELYPYADGGPVTYTPPGQRIAEGMPWGGAISAGWYQSSPKFFDYLVRQGLPETSPVVAADRESAPDPGLATGPTPGAGSSWCSPGWWPCRCRPPGCVAASSRRPGRTAETPDLARRPATFPSMPAGYRPDAHRSRSMNEERDGLNHVPSPSGTRPSRRWRIEGRRIGGISPEGRPA